MKAKLLVLFLLLTGITNAQIFGNDPEIKIAEITSENVWQITEMALVENKFSVGEFNPGEGLLNSDWITWKAIMINNRAHLHFSYTDNTLTVRIANRSYKTDNGWDEAIGKLSKKKYKIYVKAVADKIIEINNNPDLIRKAVKTSKLIPAFNPIQTIEPVEWKLIAVTNETGNSPKFVFEVTNNSANKLYVRPQWGALLSSIQSDDITHRVIPDWGITGREAPLIFPGKTSKVTMKMMRDNTWEMNTVPKFWMKIQHNSDSGNIKLLEMYSVPIPYKYQESDL